MRLFLAILMIAATHHVCAGDIVPGLEIENIYKDVYLHKSYQRIEEFGLVSSNGLVVIDNKKAFIIDTPWSAKDTRALLDWIKEQDYDPVGSISTHSHEDRTAGIKSLNSQSIPTYASNLTNEILKQENKELAKNTFANPEAFLFDGNLEAFYPGGGHTIDNIVVWLPDSKILFGGCLVRSLQAKNLGYTGEAVVNEWSNSAGKVLSRYSESEMVVPGHGKIGDISLLEHTVKLAERPGIAPTRP